MALPGELSFAKPWVKAPALEVLHTSTFSLVERTKDGIRKRCWGLAADHSQNALAFLRSNPFLQRFFVPVLDEVYLVEDQGKPSHLSLLEPYEMDAFSWAETHATGEQDYRVSGYLKEVKKLVNFVVDAHLALEKASPIFIYPDVKLENLLVKTKGVELVSMAWGDLESLRPYPPTSTLRYTMYYLPPSMILPTLASNIPYLQGKRSYLKPCPPRCFRKAMLCQQVAILASCLLMGSYSPSEIWWRMLEDKSLGGYLEEMLKEEPWWNESWSDLCKISPFLLAKEGGMDVVTFQRMTRCLEEKISKAFVEDVEGEYMERCSQGQVGNLEEWREFLLAAHEGKMKTLKATAFLTS